MLFRSEGARTRIGYEAAGDTTSVELFRNYSNELAAQGFTVLYDSSTDTKAPRRNGYLLGFGTAAFGNLATSRSYFVFYSAPLTTMNTLSAQRTKDGKTLSVHLTTVQWDKPNPTFRAQRGAYAMLDIVEAGQLQQNMVTEIGRAHV